MSMNQRIGEEMKEAMRAKDAVRLNVVRALKSAVHSAARRKREADGRPAQTPGRRICAARPTQ